MILIQAPWTSPLCAYLSLQFLSIKSINNNNNNNELHLVSQVATKQGKELDVKYKEQEKLGNEVKIVKENIKEKDKIISKLKRSPDKKPQVEKILQTASMNKDQTGNKCNTSAKSFRYSNDLDKHMDAKHSEKECIYCKTRWGRPR